MTVTSRCRLQFMLHSETQNEHGDIAKTVVTKDGAYYLQACNRM